MQNNIDSNIKKESKEKFNELEIIAVENFIKNTDHNYKTTHKRVCFIIIQRIYRRILDGYRFGGVQFNDDLIIDGHHRYIAYKLANIEFDELKGGRCHSDQKKNINDLEIDVTQDWDNNSAATRKYCTDDFLKKMERVIP